MYTSGSTLFNNTIKQPVKSYKARLKCGTEIVDSGFSSIIMTTGSSANGCYEIGTSVSAQIEVTVSDVTTVFVGKYWTLEIGIKTDSSKDYDDSTAYEFIPMGVFKVAEQGKSNGKRTFTAYDKISELNVPFDFNATTLTASTIISRIATKCGVTIDSTGITNDTLKKQTGLSCREMLGAIAMLNGCSVYANRSGKIIFKKFIKQTVEYSASDTRGFSVDEEVFSFTSFVGVTGGLIDGESTKAEVKLTPTGADTSGNVLVFYNPFFTQTIVNRLNTSGLSLKRYNVATVPLALGDIRLDPWDVVTVSDVNQTEYIIPCMSIVYSYNGGLTTQITSYGEEKGNDDSGYLSPFNRFQNAITTALLTVEKLVANIAEIAGFKIDKYGLETTYQPYDSSINQKIRINSGHDSSQGLIRPSLITITDSSNGKELMSLDSGHIWLSGYENPLYSGETINCYMEPNRAGIGVYSGSYPSSGITSMKISRLMPTYIEEAGEKLADKYAKKSARFLDSGVNTVSIPNNSTTHVGSFQVPDNGLWWIQCRVLFNANANGRRAVWVSTDDAGISVSSGVNMDAVSGGALTLFGVNRFMKFTGITSGGLSVPVLIKAFQNSGGALNMSYRVYAYRLCDSVATEKLTIGKG